MKYNPQIHHNRSIRLKGYDYSSEGAYFITICVKDRECLFGEIINGEMNLTEVGKVANKNWLNIPNHFENVEIDEYVIMPNHLHGIIVINKNENQNNNNRRCLINQTPTGNVKFLEPNISGKYNLMKNNNYLLGQIIRNFKAKTTRTIHDNKFNYFQWQRNYYEHIIRSEKSLDAIRKYIIENPLKWELDKENPINIKENKNVKKY